MALAFLGALLLLLFLLPWRRQAAGRRPGGGTEVVFFTHTLHGFRHMLKVKADLFLFLPDFLFFLPLGRGETSSSKEGLQAEGSSEIQRSRVLASNTAFPRSVYF